MLGELVDRAARILADDFVGAYLQGSFALGAGDLFSDCDFVIVTRGSLTNHQFDAIASMHDEFPTRPEHWAKHLEGSYAVVDDLRSLAGRGRGWPFVDHGSRQLVSDAHCNTAVVRWILRDCGVVLAGPPPAAFIDEVTADDLRDEMRSLLPRLLPGFLTWGSFDIAWTQRYFVTTGCRVLCTLANGRVVSKPEALAWGLDHLDARWHPLLSLAVAERENYYDPGHLADPAVSAETAAFANALPRIAGAIDRS